MFSVVVVGINEKYVASAYLSCEVSIIMEKNKSSLVWVEECETLDLAFKFRDLVNSGYFNV